MSPLLSRILWFVLPCALGAGCDLQTKALAERALGEGRGPIMLLDPWLELSLAYNRGTAFSFFPDLGVARLAMGLLAFVVVIALLFMALRPNVRPMEAIALGAIGGGALGNGIDRLMRLAPGGGTGVVDFIKVNFPWGGSWPTFNIADALLAVGIAALLLPSFVRRKPIAGTAQNG